MIATVLDSFILDKDKTFWRVELSDGTMVFQDDNRPDYEEPIAWYRLKAYCEERSLFVRQMWLTFRSHTEYIGESDTGFFFSFGLLAYPNYTEHRYVCGPIINNEIHATIWKVPELLKVEEDIRPIQGYEEKCISLSLTDTNVQNTTI